MSKTKIVLFLTRLSLGTLFFYAGFPKILNPDWTASGYISSAQTFSGFYSFLASPSILPFVNILNEWGLTLIGLSLLIGLFVRWSAPLGALIMILYYFPELNFPYVGEHSFLVDEHIIYALTLIYLSLVDAGKIWGLDGKVFKKSGK